MLVCSGSSNNTLAVSLAKKLQITPVRRSLTLFPNGEKRVFVEGDVRGEEILIVQSFSDPVDAHIIEFALLTDALKRAGAKKLVALVPWLGYSLQNDVFRRGESLAAKVVADIVNTLPLSNLYTVDIHNEEILGFFSVPAQNLTLIPLFARYVQQAKKQDAIVVSPDEGGRKRAKLFAQLLNLSLVEMSKTRDKVTGVVSLDTFSGEVAGKSCLIIDDVINTGTTIMNVAKMLKEHGAKQIRAFASHIVSTKTAVEQLDASEVDLVVVSDTVEHAFARQSKKITVVSAAEEIAKQARWG